MQSRRGGGGGGGGISHSPIARAKSGLPTHLIRPRPPTSSILHLRPLFFSFPRRVCVYVCVCMPRASVWEGSPSADAFYVRAICPPPSGRGRRGEQSSDDHHRRRLQLRPPPPPPPPPRENPFFASLLLPRFSSRQFLLPLHPLLLLCAPPRTERRMCVGMGRGGRSAHSSGFGSGLGKKRVLNVKTLAALKKPTCPLSSPPCVPRMTTHKLATSKRIYAVQWQ